MTVNFAALWDAYPRMHRPWAHVPREPPGAWSPTKADRLLPDGDKLTSFVNLRSQPGETLQHAYGRLHDGCYGTHPAAIRRSRYATPLAEAATGSTRSAWRCGR